MVGQENGERLNCETRDRDRDIKFFISAFAFFNVTFRKLYGIKIKTVEVDRDGLLSIFYRYFSLAVLTT